MTINFAEVAERISEEKKKMQERNKELLKELFTAFFDQFPDIKSIVWTQYTPYFNDGDTCEFSVGELQFSKKEWDISDISSAYELEDDEETINLYNDKTDKNLKKGLQEFNRTIQELQDAMLLTFDDHALVVATRNGFEIEEYQHG